MKLLASLALAGLGLGIVACQNRADEAPDIEEAIPLDEPGDVIDMPVEDPDANTSVTPEPTPEPGIDVMERGSNPPGMTSPPAGSKVQPAD